MTPCPDSDLLQAYLDGGLGPTETAALEARLKAEPELARALVALARDEASLREWASAQPAAEPHPTTKPPPAAEPARPRSFPWRRAAAAVVALAAALGAYLFFRSPEALPIPLAKVQEVQGTVLLVSKAGDTPVEAGQELYPGQRLSTRGEGSFAVVQYPDTTRLELGADTTIRLLSGRVAGISRVFLTEGVLAAEVVRRPQGRPLVLATAHAEVTALTSRFSFWSEPKQTRIESEAGPVHLRRSSDGQSIEVKPGTFAVAVDAGPLVAGRLPAPITRPRAILEEGTGPVVALEFAPDGGTLASGSGKGEVKVWDPATGKLLRAFKVHKAQVRAMAFRADGRLLATLCGDRVPRVWDYPTGQEVAALEGHRSAVPCLDFSPDGRTLATAGVRGRVGEVTLWQPPDCKELGTFSFPGVDVRALAFSADGKLLAGGARDGTVLLWDAKTGEQRRAFTAHAGDVTDLAFSPDGHTLASAGKDGDVVYWDTITWQPRHLTGAHPRGVRSVAFSPDGASLVTTGGDPTAKVWSLATGELQAIFKAHRSAVTVARFAPDGRTLATAGWDRTVKLWDLTRPAGDASTRLAPQHLPASRLLAGLQRPHSNATR